MQKKEKEERKTGGVGGGGGGGENPTKDLVCALLCRTAELLKDEPHSLCLETCKSVALA